MDNMDKAFEEFGLETEDVTETNKRVIEEADSIGMKVLHEDELSNPKKLQKLTKDDRRQAVLEAIVPKAYEFAEFNEDTIKENIKKQYDKMKGLYKIYNMQKYTQICLGILSAVRMGKLPNRSYLIGAPNGFGKASFVNECLITLRAQGFRVVPYVSLWELAQIRVDSEQKLMKPYMKVKDSDGTGFTNPNVYKKEDYMRYPEIIVNRFSYSQYINADCLFVYLSDPVSKDVESHTLYQLLNIRGAKGLPTIVMIGTSIDVYLKDSFLKEYIWNEIMEYQRVENSYDRLYHISCYRVKKSALDSKGEVVDTATGIVQGG